MHKKEFIRQEMKRLGFTASQLAKLLRISPTSVNRWASYKGADPKESTIYTLEVIRDLDKEVLEHRRCKEELESMKKSMEAIKEDIRALNDKVIKGV